MQSRRPHFPPAAVEWLVGHHSNRVLALSDTSYLPRMIAGSGHPVFAADKNARRVQGLARTPGVEAVLARAEAWQRPVLPVSGADVLEAGVAAGPRVRELLQKLEEGWIEGNFNADRATLIARLTSLV